ncbi:MAG: head maturation protease, ClpP-related [Pseudomonadota bacterium]
MTELRLEGFVGDDFSHATLDPYLSENAGEPVRLIVNSGGGFAHEGAAMAASIRRHGQVVAEVRGIAASAASLLVVAAQTVEMDRAAVMMIHEPAGFTMGPADAHRKTAEDLDRLSAVYAADYAAASGQSAARVAAWMKDETWFSADDAVALGFADRVSEGPAPEPVARFDYTQFRRAPAELVTLARAKGWATAKEPEGGRAA